MLSIGNGNCGLSLIPQYGSHTEAIAAYLKPVTGTFDGIPVDSLSSYHEALKKHPGYEKIRQLSSNREGELIDGLLKRYLDLYEKLTAEEKLKSITMAEIAEKIRRENQT